MSDPKIIFAQPLAPPSGGDYFQDNPSAYWQSTSNLSSSSSSSDNELDANQADWENISGDLTKRYNRMRQYIDASKKSASFRQIQGSAVPAFNRTTRTFFDANTVTAAIHSSKVEDQLASMTSQYIERLNLGPLSSVSSLSTRKGGSEVRSLLKDKSDRATSEQVLDPRTRLILFKMIGKGLFERVDGCVSTGKEANVYHAIGPHPSSFKDRDRYVTGEFRYRSGYSKSNPRKMVRLWAEKEMRNLKRIYKTGLRVPEPIEVRNNVLVMEFIGSGSWQASPRLKDAIIPEDSIESVYLEALLILRRLYHECRLIHADLSEYNILYHDMHLYVIDVSQSVEHDHPHAFDFLRSDINNVDAFFSKRGVNTLGMIRTFSFVIDEWPAERGLETPEAMLSLIDTIRHHVSPEGPSENDEEIFRKSYIPTRLKHVADAERDVDILTKGGREQLIYASVVGLPKEEEVEIDSTSTLDSLSKDDDDDDGNSVNRRPRGKRFEDKTAKRDRKQSIKDERRQRREAKKDRKLMKGKDKH